MENKKDAMRRCREFLESLDSSERKAIVDSVNGKTEKDLQEAQKQLSYYEREVARLQQQNEVLHETAWELIHRLRAIEGKC